MDITSNSNSFAESGVNSEAPIEESSGTVSSGALDVVDGAQSVASVASVAESDILTVESTLSKPASTASAVTESVSLPTYDSWLDVPLNDYSVTEGLLLCLVGAVLVAAVLKLFKLI